MAAPNSSQVGCGGSLVDSSMFNWTLNDPHDTNKEIFYAIRSFSHSQHVQRVRGSNPSIGRHVGTLTRKSLTCSCLWRFGVNLRHSICAVLGALLSSSGLEEAL